MPVGSTIELYTTILSWILYDAIWGILAYTGLILVPFIITIVNVVIETRDSAQEISAEGLIRILETRIYIMIGVVLFAAQPLINVNPSKTTYTQYRCGVTSSKSLTKTMTELAYGDSKSTLDKSTGTFAVMLNGRTPRAPIWWYLVTKLNHAITQTARQELPCQADLRTMGAGLSKLNIADKALKDELKDFYKDCWQPAANQFARERIPEDDLPTKFKGGAVYDDITWPGSEFFINRSGYYDTLRATAAVPAFPYESLRDSVKAPEPPTGVDTGGYPTCHEWWLGYPADGVSFDSDKGFRERMLTYIKNDAIPDDSEDSTGAWWKFWAEDKFATAGDADDALIKTTLNAESEEIQLELTNGASEYGGVMGSTTDHVLRGMRSLIGGAGLLIGGAKKAVEVEMVRQVAPMVQSMVLLIFTVGLPLLLAIGSFSLKNMIALTLLQFSIIFWGFLFALAAWLDNFLLSGLWSGADKNANMLMDTLMPNTSGVGTQILAISWVTWMLYTLAPLAFTYCLGVIGIKAGSLATNAINSSSNEISGQSGAGVGVAQKIITKGKGK
ncbi:MAG: hypothetical protein B0W54_07835 [Cellvibrio sp. 79]|nr:MAG: hypothetical protein B0W54_07835 [Cellvibrio sp. 79]